MSRAAVGTLIDRWLNEPEFRAAIRRDPEGTVRATAAELDAEEWVALREIDWSVSDEELNARINKGM